MLNHDKVLVSTALNIDLKLDKDIDNPKIEQDKFYAVKGNWIERGANVGEVGSIMQCVHSQEVKRGGKQIIGVRGDAWNAEGKETWIVGY